MPLKLNVPRPLESVLVLSWERLKSSPVLRLCLPFTRLTVSPASRLCTRLADALESESPPKLVKLRFGGP